MANRRYTGTVVAVTVDNSNATITLRVRGILPGSFKTETFWTNDKNTARFLDSFFQPGETGWVNADPATGEIDGFGK